jgi:putative Holliday junction resolvase
MKKKIVAIDFGMKRMGLAISNDTKTMALPWTTVTDGFPSLINMLETRKTEIETIIVGLPLLMNGSKGEMAQIVETFAKKLETEIGIPVVLVDERLSSKQAESALRETGGSRKERTKKTDETAATFLLQSFLYLR